jgi:hypothetical protein
VAKKREPFVLPAIANTDAMATAEKAAAAVGLTVAELCNLLVDHGITAIPPDGGMTQKYTLEDLGARLWTSLQQHPRSKRAEWFKGLTDPQRGALIVKLRNTGFASAVIATELGITESAVMRTYQAYASEVGQQVVGIRLDTIAGQLHAAAERAKQLAIEAGDHKAFWAVERDYLKALQSIGIVDSAIHRVEVTHKVDDVTKQEIDALVKLEAKKITAAKLVENAKDASFDTVPKTRDEDEPEED